MNPRYLPHVLALLSVDALLHQANGALHQLAPCRPSNPGLVRLPALDIAAETTTASLLALLRHVVCDENLAAEVAVLCAPALHVRHDPPGEGYIVEAVRLFANVNGPPAQVGSR